MTRSAVRIFVLSGLFSELRILADAVGLMPVAHAQRTAGEREDCEQFWCHHS